MAKKLAADALERELSEIEAEINIVSGLIGDRINENARVAQDQTEYRAQMAALEERQNKAVERKAEVSAEIDRRRARQQEIELHFRHLRELDLLTEFRDEDWLAMVDHMTVYSKTDIWITFKDGSEIKAGEQDG